MAESAASPTSGEDALLEFPDLLEQLDSDEYEQRQSAATRLAELLVLPGAGAAVAERVQQRLLQPDVSFEVRAGLVDLLERLPNGELTPPTPLTADEIQSLLGDLGHPEFSRRLTAAHRLALQIHLPRQIGPLLSQYKQQLAREDLSSEARRIATFLWDRTRAAWVTGDAEDFGLPEVSSDQIEQWIDLVAAQAPSTDAPAADLTLKPVSAAAALTPAAKWTFHELEDVLIREIDQDKVVEAISRRLEDFTLSPIARQALQELINFSKPALVAEYWSGGEHLNIQHLLVDVPQFPQNARVASHFDQVNDKTARCVSGNNLVAGQTYPIGVAIIHPHPGFPEAFFHLMSLPTPRRRLAYDYQVRRPQAVRLKEISERTVDSFLQSGRRLTGREVVLLSVLHPEATNRFAVKYLKAVDDGPLVELPISDLVIGNVSAHGMLCVLLAGKGQQDLLPVLMECIEDERIEQPAPDAPYDAAWLAVLGIAGRFEGSEVDALLASLIDRTEPLVLGLDEGRDVGATAAAMLLKRHGQDPADFKLEARPEHVLTSLQIEGYRFEAPEDRAAVHGWWKARTSAEEPESPAPQ